MKDKGECRHNYALRADTWLRWRCCGCSVMKWTWVWRKIKRKLREENK